MNAWKRMWVSSEYTEVKIWWNGCEWDQNKITGSLNWKPYMYDQLENLTVQNTQRWMVSDALKLLTIQEHSQKLEVWGTERLLGKLSTVEILGRIINLHHVTYYKNIMTSVVSFSF